MSKNKLTRTTTSPAAPFKKTRKHSTSNKENKGAANLKDHQATKPSAKLSHLSKGTLALVIVRKISTTNYVSRHYIRPGVIINDNTTVSYNYTVLIDSNIEVVHKYNVLPVDKVLNSRYFRRLITAIEYNNNPTTERTRQAITYWDYIVDETLAEKIVYKKGDSIAYGSNESSTRSSAHISRAEYIENVSLLNKQLKLSIE